MRTTEQKETGEKMHVYEASFLIMPSVSEDALPAEVSAIHALLETAKAEIIAEEFPKMIPLAYTMERVTESKKKKFNEAYFGWVKFEIPVAALKSIEQGLEKRPNILRHLIIKTVRENTMYSTRMAAERKAEETAEAATRSEATDAADALARAASQKEIDKSIDALVIN